MKTKSILFCLALVISFYANATFTLSVSGTTIEQTGTDTDLSGLIGIAGVTKNGNQYTLDGLRLEINGNLTMNGFVERLRFINSPTTGQNNSKAQIAVRTGATFTVLASRTINGDTVNRVLPVIDFGDFGIDFGSNSFTNDRRHLESDTGATVNLSGVFTANTSTNGLAYSFDGTTNLTDVYFINQGSNQGNNQQIAFSQGGDVTIDNANVVGYAYTDRGGNYLSVNGLSVAENNEGFVWNDKSTTPLYLPINDFAPSQIGQRDWRTNLVNGGADGSVVNLINSAKGNNTAYIRDQGTHRNMRAIITNRLNITPVDNNFSSISATVYGVDVDNGNRDVDFTPPGQSLIAASGDIEYNQTGSTVTFDVVSGIFKPDETLDARGILGGADLDFYAISYQYNITSFQPNLTGLGDKSISPIMFEDTSITETNKATVDAYTELDTSTKFYDRAKAYLVDNYAGETAIIVNRSGNEINAGSYNVVIDATAATAFAFDGTTITVKATQFVGNIITTATITQSNGATIYGGYQDSTGTYKFLDLEWTGNTSPLNVSVVNLDDNSNILPPTSATNTYTSHFVMPSPVPTSGTEVRITSSSGTILYNQVIPTDDFDFINLRVALNDVSSEENQHKILRLAERLLAKSEAINNSLTGSTTPTITINETITNVLNYGTLKNQEAILGILIRLLNQVSATRESYKQ